MNKFFKLIAIITFALTIAACDQKNKLEQEYTSIKNSVTSASTKKSQRIITFYFGALDTLNALNTDVIALPTAKVPSYLEQYKADKYVNAGGMKEPNLALIKTLKPDLIIISAHQGKNFDSLAVIAPTIN